MVMDYWRLKIPCLKTTWNINCGKFKNQISISKPFSCLRLRQWPVTYLITLSDWIMSCQPGRHVVVTVCEPDWKHKWAAYKSFDETSSFNNL